MFLLKHVVHDITCYFFSRESVQIRNEQVCFYTSTKRQHYVGRARIQRKTCRKHAISNAPGTVQLGTWTITYPLQKMLVGRLCSFEMCQGRSTPYVGDGHLTFNDGILIMGPYKPLRTWVDEFPPPMEMSKGGSWDSTRSHKWGSLLTRWHSGEHVRGRGRSLNEFSYHPLPDRSCWMKFNGSQTDWTSHSWSI